MTQILTIALDLRHVLPESTGIGQYGKALALSLIRVAPQHRYIFIGSKGSEDTLRIPGAQLEYVWTQATPSPSDRYFRNVWENVQLPRLLRQAKVDVFHGIHSVLPLRRLDSATVVTLHDLSAMRLVKMHNRLISDLYPLRAKRSVALADHIITVSHQSRREIITAFPVSTSDISVVYHGVDERFSVLPDGLARRRLQAFGLREPFILSVGTIEPRKNHLRLIKAFEEMGDSHPQVSLVLAGRNGWLNSGVYEAAQNSRFKDRIRFLNFVPDADLPELYRMAAVFAYPSLYEGFGMPIVEAMACGTPVLTSAVSSPAEIAKGAALLVDPLSPREIAEGLRSLLEDERRRSRLAAAGLRRASEFSWEAAARATLLIYERVADGRLNPGDARRPASGIASLRKTR